MRVRLFDHSSERGGRTINAQERKRCERSRRFCGSTASFFADCETQAEVDELWEQLSAGGEKSRCGWLKDKYGLWWQVIPSTLGKLMSDSNPGKAHAVMQAMLKMDKIVIDDLRRAYEAA